MPSESSSFETIKPFLRLLEGSIEQARQRRLQQEQDEDGSSPGASPTSPSGRTSDDETTDGPSNPRLARPTRFQSDQGSW